MDSAILGIKDAPANGCCYLRSDSWNTPLIFIPAEGLMFPKGVSPVHLSYWRGEHFLTSTNHRVVFPAVYEPKECMIIKASKERKKILKTRIWRDRIHLDLTMSVIKRTCSGLICELFPKQAVC